MSALITILIDNESSWVWEYVDEFVNDLSMEHSVRLVGCPADVPEGDILFLLGCTRLTPGEVLKRNRINLVVHESRLPDGRGWSPLAWQVSQGLNAVPITLLEAVGGVDAGPVHLTDVINLDGTELLPEIRHRQWEKTRLLIRKFLALWPNSKPRPQTGTPTYFPRRTKDHDRLDVNLSLAEQFDHLRVLDNERYPGWFEYRGKKYIIKIYPDSDASGAPETIENRRSNSGNHPGEVSGKQRRDAIDPVHLSGD